MNTTTASTVQLSVVINTKNSGETLARTLASVAWADEIVIVDMASSDDTVALAKKATTQVFEHPDVGYVEPARNFAINKARGEWILVVDADEEVSSTLREFIEIRIGRKPLPRLHSQLTEIDLTAECYYVPRKNIIFGQWIEKTGWWPDFVLRFFRKEMVEWSDEIHSIPITHGLVKELPADEKFALTHHNYQTVEQYIDRLNRYTTIEAKSATPVTINESSLLLSVHQEQLRRLFAERGVDDGLHGLALGLLQSFYQLSTQLKVWQKQGFPPKKPQAATILPVLERMQREVAYWIADWQVEHTTGWRRVSWRARRWWATHSL